MIDLQASAFGKLPFTGDFIKVEAFGTQLSWLDLWFQGGMAKAHEQLEGKWDETYAVAAPLRILHYTKDGCLAGVVVPGQDRVGRRFPCAVYTVLTGRAITRRPTLVPILLAEFLDAAEALLTSDLSDMDMPTFRERVIDLGGSVDEKAALARLEEHLKTRKVRDLWDVCFENDDDPKRLILLLNLSTLLPASSKPGYVLRLPGSDTTGSAAVWIELATELRKGPPNLVARRSSGETDARLLVCDPTPAHFLQLLLPGQEGADVCDVAGEGVESERMLARATEQFGALARDGNLSLARLVKEMKKRR